MRTITCWLDIKPPKTTAQEKQVTFRHGRPIFYEPARLKQAKALLIQELAKHAPAEPITGPCRLTVIWIFKSPKRKYRRELELKITKPDTDNLDKMLKDCLTKTGYWQDDALCAIEHIEKRWSNCVRELCLFLRK